ncbi:hypothetical protein [Arthrobacter sp. MP_2.3]
MPRFTKDDVTVETSVPREIVELRSQGFTEHAAKTAEVKQADAEAAKSAK